MWTVFHAIKRSWTQHFVAQFSGFLILIMTYSAVIFIATSLFNVQQIFDIWGRINKVTVYMNSETSDEAYNNVVEYLTAHPLVKSHRLISSQESADKFNEKFSKISSQKIKTRQLDEFFPQYFEVNLNESLAYKTGVGHLESLATSLTSQFKSVKNVSYGKRWLSRYVTLLSTTNSIGWFLIFIFVASAVIVSASVIKTILYSKRDEIEILEFIGADDFSIYLPQIINVLVLSCVAFAAAVGANYFLLYNLKNGSNEIISPQVLSQIQFLPWTSVFAIFVACLVSVFAYSLLSIFGLLPRRKKALFLNEVFH